MIMFLYVWLYISWFLLLRFMLSTLLFTLQIALSLSPGLHASTRHTDRPRILDHFMMYIRWHSLIILCSIGSSYNSKKWVVSPFRIAFGFIFSDTDCFVNGVIEAMSQLRMIFVLLEASHPGFDKYFYVILHDVGLNY